VAQGRKRVKGGFEGCCRERMAGPRLLLVVLCTLCTCTMASVPEFLAPTPNLGQAQNITGCDATLIISSPLLSSLGIIYTHHPFSHTLPDTCTHTHIHTYTHTHIHTYTHTLRHQTSSSPSTNLQGTGGAPSGSRCSLSSLAGSTQVHRG
jgi:hypothetical protein